MKNIKSRLIPCLPGFINIIEKILSEESLNGWKLISKSCWDFVFEKSNPKEREYILYSKFDCSKGIDYHFLSVKDKFCVKNSKVNDCCNVFEVDTSKKNIELTMFIQARNRYYKKRYIVLTIFFVVCLVLSILLTYHTNLCYIPFVVLFLLIYNIISLFVLCVTEKKCVKKQGRG